MTFELFSRVVLRNDIPAHSLKKGDVVTIVEAHSGVGTQEQGYSVEVFNATGETIAVVTVPESYLESLRSTEILHVRQLQQVAEPSALYKSTKQ